MEADALLQDRVALSLGRMMMRFASLESMMRFVLMSVLDLDPDDETVLRGVVSGLSFKRLRSTLVAVVHMKLHDGDDLHRLKAVSARIAKVEERRNTLTHSSWNYSQLPKLMRREKHQVGNSGRFRTQAEAFDDARSLDEFVIEVDSCVHDLSRWYLRTYLGVGDDVVKPT